MPKQSTDRLSTSSQLLKALTQPEIAQLIDALLGVLSSELQEQVISQLPTDTQQTVGQIRSSYNELSWIGLLGAAIRS
jgi:hypothetical protein